jgi:hypothetical protein
MTDELAGHIQCAGAILTRISITGLVLLIDIFEGAKGFRHRFDQDQRSHLDSSTASLGIALICLREHLFTGQVLRFIRETVV